MTAPIYLTPAELAARWRVSPDCIRRLCRRGELQAMAVGRRGSRKTDWRIPLAAVEAREAVNAQTPQRASTQPPAASVGLDGFSLPDGYEPRFPALWEGQR